MLVLFLSKGYTKMEFLQTVSKRKSVRSYLQKQIDDSLLEEIIKVGCAAPVAFKKYDSLHITVIQNQEILSQISEDIKQIRSQTSDPLYNAPTVILISSTELPAPGLNYANTGFVMENMSLAATNQNIESVVVWGVGLAIKQNKSSQKKISLPTGFEPIAGLALGYANDSASTEKSLSLTISTNFVK